MFTLKHPFTMTIPFDGILSSHNFPYFHVINTEQNLMIENTEINSRLVFEENSFFHPYFPIINTIRMKFKQS